ncbi:MAG: GNAT family N-acetyltransferase [Methanomassiliicoccales archaeon]
MASDVVIKDAGREGARLAVRWAAQEGWNPGLHDAEAFYAADPHGFRIAYLNGEVAGTYSIVRYDEGFAFGGFYIVRKEERGHGVGREMLAAVLREAEPYNFGADGVVAMVPTYERHGLCTHFRSARFLGRVQGRADVSLRSLDDVGVEAVEAYDRGIFLHPRPAFLKEFLAAPDTQVAVATDSKGDLRGYGVLRPCVSGHKLAPLFSDSPAVAEKLFSHLASLAPQEICLDVPGPNGEGNAMAVKHGMREVFACARIYTKRPEPLPLDRIFGVTSFELG